MKKELTRNKRIGDYYLCSLNEYFYILRKRGIDYKDGTVNEKLFHYIKNTKIEDEDYELLEFKYKNEDAIIHIFEAIVKINKPLNESVLELKKLLLKSMDNISSFESRGIAAELYIISKFGYAPNEDKFSIYDLRSDNGDVEVKSFSKVKKEIKVSYQQLTNNLNAEIYAIETFETSEGKSISDLLRMIPNEYQSKYLLYNELKTRKYSFGELKIYTARELGKGLKMPENSVDATFTFKVN